MQKFTHDKNGVIHSKGTMLIKIMLPVMSPFKNKQQGCCICQTTESLCAYVTETHPWTLLTALQIHLFI